MQFVVLCTTGEAALQDVGEIAERPDAVLACRLDQGIGDRPPASEPAHVIKGWLTAPVVEVIDGRPVQTTEARRTKRGTPQGGVISPLLANCYFRRFLLACHHHGHRDQLDAHR